jgi:hypothetical protein
MSMEAEDDWGRSGRRGRRDGDEGFTLNAVDRPLTEGRFGGNGQKESEQEREHREVGSGKW